MPASPINMLQTIFPVCRSILSEDLWNEVSGAGVDTSSPESFPERLIHFADKTDLPGYLPDLARLEWNIFALSPNQTELPTEVNRLSVNPALTLLHLSWQHLTSFVSTASKNQPIAEPGEELILVWQSPHTRKVAWKVAEDADLLALKIIIEDIDPRSAATTADAPVSIIHASIRKAAQEGILVRPASRIRRDPDFAPQAVPETRDYLSTLAFTLQWHLTQACDLHCKHCYDRSNRTSLPLDQAIGILDDLSGFCDKKNVEGQVTFTGGNPLLYPRFTELYQAAADRGFMIAILGNPTSQETIEELIAIQKPEFYQVSLEGLAAHNNDIRGTGHFDRVIEFLSLLKKVKIYSMVMLTLTAENQDQVLPLAEFLKDKTDLFTFNRLSMVGEGANLLGAPIQNFSSFLRDYRTHAETNPAMSTKDSLFNIINHQEKSSLVGGCAGFGCGAAFNFLSLLSDGEMHACRKFPSPIGTINEMNIGELYDSKAARRYRKGTSECTSCEIRPVCGGCLAVAHSHGLDIFKERDPYCFMDMN